MRCDVLVVGGGSAGLAAAVAAARRGARTVLLERHGALGGMASASLVHSICGLYLLREGEGFELANTGFPAEFAGRLAAAGGAWGPYRMGRVDVLMQHPTAFACLSDELAAEADPLELRLHSEVIGVERDGAGRRIESVELACRGVRERVEPGAVVDASGDGVAAALGGGAFEQAPADQLQRPAFIFALQEVDPAALSKEGRLHIAHAIASAVRDGRLPEGALGAALRATGRGGEAFVTIDLQGPPEGEYDPTEPRCLTALEMHGRHLAREVAGFLRAEVRGFERSTVSALPGRVGVRESRRVVGEYTLTAEDVEEGAEFEDSVGLGTWPREMRETARGPRLRFPRDSRPCAIPLRALRAAGLDNVFMAGRCISCVHEAQASLRVIGTCLVTGEAAGLAAARLADAARGASAGGATDRVPVDAAGVRSEQERLMRPAAERWAGSIQ